MAYQPFLIAPFGSGLDTDTEIWMLPKDAFSDIVNGHIHHGEIEKRAGYSLLGYMAHDPTATITGVTKANPAVVSAAGHTFVDGNQIIITNVQGMTEINKRVFTVVNAVAGVSFELTAENSTNYNAYTGGGYAALYDGSRIMGIHTFIDNTGVKNTVVFDTKRAAVFDGTNDRFTPLDTTDIFSDDSTAYVWATQWRHTDGTTRLYFTNGNFRNAGLDGIRYYDGTSATTTSFNPSISSVSGFTLDGAKTIHTLKSRLLAFHTYENGAWQPQRLRFSAAQNASNWDEAVAGGGGYVDAPTGDQIISTRALQDSIIVFFTSSVWIVRPVSDPALPFRWDKLNDFRATSGRMATLEYDQFVVSVGARGITATDGTQTQRIDHKIQNFVDEEINTDEVDKLFGIRDFNTERSYLLYPQTESDEANAALVMDDESRTFSKYKYTRMNGANQVDMNVFGFSTVVVDYTAADFNVSNNKDWDATDFENDETSLSFYWGKNNEVFVGGDRDGVVFFMDDTNKDYGTDIEFSLTSAGWNPYIQEGSEAQLGYLDIYASANKETSLKIEFFKNDNNTAYSEQNITLFPNLNTIANVTNILINSDISTGFVITAPSHGMSAGEEFYIYGLKGCDFLNDLIFTVTSVTENTITVTYDLTPYALSITGLSQANPAVVTSLKHALSNGDMVYISGVGGMTEVNGLNFTVSGVSVDYFSLSGIDSTGYVAYTTGGYILPSYLAGGVLTQKRFYSRNVWKRAFAGGIGYVHKIRITDDGDGPNWKLLAFRPWFRKRGRRTL